MNSLLTSCEHFNYSIFQVFRKLGSVLLNYMVVGFTLTQKHHMSHVCEICLLEQLN